MNLELTPVEQQMVFELLKSRLGELKQEIHHSRISTFTDQLKERARLMSQLMDKLDPAKRTEPCA